MDPSYEPLLKITFDAKKSMQLVYVTNVGQFCLKFWVDYS